MHFKPLSNVKLDNHSTIRTGGNAEAFSIITSGTALLAAYEWADHHDKEVRLIGTGSNIIWSDSGFRGFEVKHRDQTSCVIKIGSGEALDDIVDRTVILGLSGIECLSMIPGTVGCAITQNSGAYGQEIAVTLVEVEVYDRDHGAFRTFDGQACQFAYRTSIFKKPSYQRFAILEISLTLKVCSTAEVRHPALMSALQEKTVATAADIS